MSVQHNSAGARGRRSGPSESHTLDSFERHSFELVSSESYMSEATTNRFDSSQTDSSEMVLVESGLNEPAGGTHTESEHDYRQHLYRLFGKETADYFLVPSPDHREASAWYNLLTEHMGEQVSAVALWETLREHATSNTTATLEETEAVYTKVCVDGERQRAPGHLGRLAGVRRMFHLARLRQAFSAQLLHPAEIGHDPTHEPVPRGRRTRSI